MWQQNKNIHFNLQIHQQLTDKHEKAFSCLSHCHTIMWRALGDFHPFFIQSKHAIINHWFNKAWKCRCRTLLLNAPTRRGWKHLPTLTDSLRLLRFFLCVLATFQCLFKRWAGFCTFAKSFILIWLLSNRFFFVLPLHAHRAPLWDSLWAFDHWLIILLVGTLKVGHQSWKKNLQGSCGGVALSYRCLQQNTKTNRFRRVPTN